MQHIQVQFHVDYTDNNEMLLTVRGRKFTYIYM